MVCSEAEEGKGFDETRVKQFTGGENLKGRGMNKDFYEFKPTLKLIIVANHLMQVRGTDRAIWRRLEKGLITFAVTIPDAERDNLLRDKLWAEASGILNWALEGCRVWLKDGLRPPKEVTEAAEAYRTEMDLVGKFIDDCCDRDAQSREKIETLYQAYVAWCEKHDVENPLSKPQLSKQLKRRGHASASGTGNYYYCNGLSLKKELYNGLRIVK